MIVPERGSGLEVHDERENKIRKQTSVFMDGPPLRVVLIQSMKLRKLSQASGGGNQIVDRGQRSSILGWREFLRQALHPNPVNHSVGNLFDREFNAVHHDALAALRDVPQLLKNECSDRANVLR